jgi:hypothetical protein
MAQFELINHGSIALLLPLSPEAEAWVNEHIAKDAMHFNGAVVIEPRYVAAIVEGIREEGMEVELG